MGFFGKLFEKKECDICGGEIGLLGNRKLEDGNCCKECAKKLSYWFDERRHSTVEQIKAQLEYREANKAEVAAFATSKVYGEGTELRIDLEKKKFMLVRTKKLAEENPDVLDLSQVTGVEIDIDEDRDEEKREDKDGNEISYNPPRYTYSYNFEIIIHVRHPYFDEMRFTVNNHVVHVDPNRGAPAPTTTGGFLDSLFGSALDNANDPRQSYEYRKYERMCQEIREILTTGTTSKEMVGNAFQAVLSGIANGGTQAAQQSAQEAQSAQPAAPARPAFCPNCGAPAEGGKFCQSCGSPLQ